MVNKTKSVSANVTFMREILEALIFLTLAGGPVLFTLL
jgi:hypothetical protein